MRKKGFTLAELLAVIAILAIIAIIAIPNVIKTMNQSAAKVMEEQVTQVSTAAELYTVDNCKVSTRINYNCPSYYETVSNNQKYLCLKDIQTSKYIGKVTYKSSECDGMIIYDKNGENGETYLYCGRKNDGTYTYVSNNAKNVNIKPDCVDPSVLENTTYTINYYVDAELYETRNVNGGQLATELSPTSGNYIFAGWYTNSDFSNKYNFSAPVYSNLTLYGTFVMLGDVNGDKRVTTADTSALYRSLVDLILLSEPGKVAGDVNQDGILDGKDGCIILAYSIEKVSSLPYLGNDVNNIEYYIDGSLYAVLGKFDGETIENNSAPTKEGYTFSGWYTDTNLTSAYNFSTQVYNDLKLYGRFVAN